MNLKNTAYSNYKIVIDEFDIAVAVQIDGQIKYKLYDRLFVAPDSIGYICEGITQGGCGTLMRVRQDTSDYFFGVLMDNGEFGYMKDSRIVKKIV